MTEERPFIIHYTNTAILSRVQPEKLRYFDFSESFARQINFEEAWETKNSEAHTLHSAALADLSCGRAVQSESEGVLCQ